MRHSAAAGEGSAGRMPGTVSSAYFRRISFFWMAVITASFGYYTLLVFWPQSVPYKSLGQFGSFSKYLVDNYHPYLYICCCAAWAVHVAEALYSVKLCSDKGITNISVRLKWAFQTFLFGIASLWHLLSYDPEQKEK